MGNGQHGGCHRALMDHFSETATRQTAAADDHLRMAQAYRGGRNASAAMHKDLAGIPR